MIAWLVRIWFLSVVIFSFLSVFGGIQTLVTDTVTYTNPLFRLGAGLGIIVNGLIVGICYLLLLSFHRWSKWTAICYIVSQVIIPTLVGIWVTLWIASRPDPTALSTKVTAVIVVVIVAILFYGLLITAVVVRKK